METALLLLRKIGMRSSYAGFNYLACAVALVFEHQEYLRKVTKNLYVMVGKEYGVSNVCVEAAIRTLITSYWNQNEDKILAPILGYPLFEKGIYPLCLSLCFSYNVFALHIGCKEISPINQDQKYCSCNNRREHFPRFHLNSYNL